MDINEVRKYFPVTEKFIYFNHAAVAPMNLVTCVYLNKYLDDYLLNGSINYLKWLGVVSEVRQMVAEMINAASDNIAIIKNTTSGILLVANGLDFKEGDNVIVPEREFPANVYPWLNLKGKGVEVRFAKWRDGRVFIDDLLALIDDRTRLLSISHVQFSNGFKIDITKLGAELKKRGVLFFVDAIQSMGVFDIDVLRDNIDFLAADSHKWLLGPEGVGFFYCRPDNLDKLNMTNFGYTSVVNSSDYLDYDTTLKPNASRFEEGSLNMLGIHASFGSFNLLKNAGSEKIRQNILELTDYLAERLTGEGCIIRSPRDNEMEKSGIISFSVDGSDPDLIYKQLMKNNCYVAFRDGAIRLSPHFYNTLDEADSFIDILKSMV